MSISETLRRLGEMASDPSTVFTKRGYLRTFTKFFRGERVTHAERQAFEHAATAMSSSYVSFLTAERLFDLVVDPCWCEDFDNRRQADVYFMMDHLSWHASCNLVYAKHFYGKLIESVVCTGSDPDHEAVYLNNLTIILRLLHMAVGAPYTPGQPYRPVQTTRGISERLDQYKLHKGLALLYEAADTDQEAFDILEHLYDLFREVGYFLVPSANGLVEQVGKSYTGHGVIIPWIGPTNISLKAKTFADGWLERQQAIQHDRQHNPLVDRVIENYDAILQECENLWLAIRTKSQRLLWGNGLDRYVIDGPLAEYEPTERYFHAVPNAKYNQVHVDYIVPWINGTQRTVRRQIEARRILAFFRIKDENERRRDALYLLSFLADTRALFDMVCPCHSLHKIKKRRSAVTTTSQGQKLTRLRTHIVHLPSNRRRSAEKTAKMDKEFRHLDDPHETYAVPRRTAEEEDDLIRIQASRPEPILAIKSDALF